MQILEQFIEGKVSPAKCEDAIVVTKDYIAVIDGVTSDGKHIFNGDTTGRIAAKLITEAIEEIPEEDNPDIEEIIERVNIKIEHFYETSGFNGVKYVEGPEASMILFSRKRRTIWIVNDCQTIIDGEHYWKHEKTDTTIANMRALMSHITMLEEDTTADEFFKDNDPIRPFVREWTIKARNVFANKEYPKYGYAVINGQEIPNSLIHTIQLDDNEHEIVLASDGYPELRGTLEESEQALRQVIDEDPHQINDYPETKGLRPGNNSLDDRAYIRFKVPAK